MRRARNVARLTICPVRDRGFRETVRSLRLTWSARRRDKLDGFDQRYGTDTSRTWRWSDLDAIGPDVPPLWRYFPVIGPDFEPIMRALDIEHDRYAFVDIGSGKGRALLLASSWPFRRIIGVELSPSLSAIAERNVQMYRSPSQQCDRFELVCSDAALWQPPDDERLLVYFFQPFPGDVFARVMENLAASLARKPRPLIVLYLNPVFEDVVLGPGWLHTVRKVKPTRPDEAGWAVYANEHVRRP